MHPLYSAIESKWPHASWAGSSTVIACSGGADSIALLDALHAIDQKRTELIVAHLNHGLRGAESDCDMAFVESMAQQRGLRFVGERLVNPQASASESYLRDARHSFLRRVAEEHHATWIAMAHHADDCVESMLMNLLRGTGPKGLSGIPVRRSIDESLTIIRPLIGVFRKEIEQYLRDRELDYRVDSSNLTSDYTRNRIRLELLPLLREFAGSDQLDHRIFQCGQQIGEQQAVIHAMAREWTDHHMTRCCKDDATTYSVPVSSALALPWTVLQEVFVVLWHRSGWPLREMSARHWQRLRAMIERARETRHPLRLQLPGPVEAQIRKRVLSVGKRSPN